MIKKQCIIFILFCFIPLYGQNPKAKLETLYKDVTIGKCKEVAIEKSLAEVHSILKVSSITTEEKLKAFLILANLYKFKGDSAQALRTANKAQVFALHKKQYLWEARFLGFMATEYRQSNMLDLGEEKLTLAIEIAKKAPESDEQARFFRNAYYELAYHADYYSRYQEALSHMRHSNQWTEKIKSTKKEFSLAANYQFMGELFNRLYEADSALLYLHRALELVDNEQDINTRTLRNYISNSIGATRLIQKDFTAAEQLFSTVLSSPQQFRTTDLNQELYKNLVHYYQDTGRTDSLTRYQAKLDSVSLLITQGNVSTINTVTNNLRRENKLLKETNNAPYLFINGLIGFIGIAAFWFSRRYKKKKAPVPYLKRMDLKPEELNIAKDTEQRIEDRVKHFEEHSLYLTPNLSATKLANEFNTNPKYLAHVLKKMYGKDTDFTSYINTLKINHIADLLEKEPTYQVYKISVLAEIAGYSSHSKFAAVFKKVKGCPPSDFIAGLKEQNIF